MHEQGVVGVMLHAAIDSRINKHPGPCKRCGFPVGAGQGLEWGARDAAPLHVAHAHASDCQRERRTAERRASAAKRPPLAPERAGHVFAGFGLTDDPDLKELDHVIRPMGAAAKVAFWSVRCLGATPEAAAADLDVPADEIHALLARTDRTLAALGEDATTFAARQVAGFPADAVAALRGRVGRYTRGPRRTRHARGAQPG